MTRHKSRNTVLTSAVRGASSGVTSHINASSYEFAMLCIYITAKSGSPTLDISLETSPVDPALDSTKWSTVYEEPTITNAAIGTTFPKNFRGHRQEDFSGWLRVRYTVAGSSTPTLTFSIEIEIK